MSNPQKPRKIERVVLVTLLGIGLALVIVSSLSLLRGPDNPPLRVQELAFTASETLPHILVDDGRLLLPAEDGTWQESHIEGIVHGVFADTDDTLWAATSIGLQRYTDSAWEVVDDTPHGALIPMADDVVRIDTDGQIIGTLERTVVPDASAPANVSQILQTGDESHVARAGDAIYISIDINDWAPIESPAPIHAIWEDGEGHIYASTELGILRWWWENNTWETVFPLGNEQPFDDFRAFGEQVFAVAAGQLMRYDGDMWQAVALPGDAPHVNRIEVDKHGYMWVFDHTSERMWTTTDGDTWTATSVRLMSDAPPPS